MLECWFRLCTFHQHDYMWFLISTCDFGLLGTCKNHVGRRRNCNFRIASNGMEIYRFHLGFSPALHGNGRLFVVSSLARGLYGRVIASARMENQDEALYIQILYTLGRAEFNWKINYYIQLLWRRHAKYKWNYCRNSRSADMIAYNITARWWFLKPRSQLRPQNKIKWIVCFVSYILESGYFHQIPKKTVRKQWTLFGCCCRSLCINSLA